MPAFVLLVALFASVTAALAPTHAVAKDDVTVSPEPFFKHSDYGAMKLAPSGKYIGALVPVQGRLRLAVIDLETRSSHIAVSMDGEDIDRFEWVNDNRLVFTVADLQAGLGQQRSEGLFAANRDGTDFRILAPTARSQARRLQTVYRYTRVARVLHDGSDDVIIVSNELNAKYPDVYRMDTRTGRKTLKTYGKPGDVVRWVTDRKGEVRAAVTSEKSLSSRVFWRSDGEAKWIQLAEFRLGESGFQPIDFDGDGGLIVASNIGRDTMAVYRYDTATRAIGEQLAAHPQSDLGENLLYDPRKHRIVGISYEGPRPGSAWFDEDWAKLQKSVDAALPGRMNLFRPEGPVVLVYSYSDTDPGAYYLLDTRKGRLEFVAAPRKGIEARSHAGAQAGSIRSARWARDSRISHAAKGTGGKKPAARALRARRSVGPRRNLGMERGARVSGVARICGPRA